MAPEQIERSAACDGRTDLYALGVVTYELLTAHRLFPRRTTTEIQDGTQVMPPPGLIERELGGLVGATIARCLRPDPDERYPHVTTFFNALCDAVQRQGAPGPS
jgi:serine/threonine-protein kinase